MINYEQRTHPTTNLNTYTFFSEPEGSTNPLWHIEIKEVPSNSPRWPILHEWFITFEEGVVCEGSIGTLEDAKRYAEIAYNAFRAALS